MTREPRPKSLREIRVGKKLTIYDVGELADVSHSTVSRIESGLQGVSVGSARRLAAAYGLTLDAFLQTVDLLQSGKLY